MIVHNYLWSGANGSMGGATFQKWKGKQTVRTKPTTVENPQTPAQMFNRAKFAILTILARLLRPVVIPGMKEQATDMTEYNAFVKYNIKTALTGTNADNVAVDYAELVVSRGTAPGLQLATFSIEAGVLTLELAPTSNNVIPDGSVAHVVLYNTSTEVLDFVTREFSNNICDESVNVNNQTFTNVVAYVFYVNAVTGKVSDSQFVSANI